jgi:serine/threonine protein kinase
MSKCRECGFELKSEVRYCPNCATKVDPSRQPAGSADAFTGTISGTATIFAPERADSSTDLETGREFHGRYKIERKLGQGAMGVVYLAGDKLTGRQVALKLINPVLMNSGSARERFLREGLIARDIRHRNVVAVYDVSEMQGQYYLVMEYLSGETLRNWLHRTIQAGEDVPYAIAEKIIRSILEGLDAAHTSGVIHRDVKPENIMLTGNPETGDGSMKILDFGIARAMDGPARQLVTTTTSTGTALYMAPEQKTAADTVGPPADLYAVSAIFYELLLGVAPTGRWAPLSKERGDLPAGIDDVIDKGLSSRPRSRYQSAQEYLKAISEIRNVPLTPALPPASRPPSSSPVASAGSMLARPAAEQRLSHAAGDHAPAPQIISKTGRLRTESLVWTNAPAETLHQTPWQVLAAFGVKQMLGSHQPRTIRGATGFSWKSLGQKISADMAEVSGGSTVNIVGQDKGLALADLGRGKEEVHTMATMLIQKLTSAGWNAHVVREVHCCLPTWLVVLITLGLLLLFITLIPSINEFLEFVVGPF